LLRQYCTYFWLLIYNFLAPTLSRCQLLDCLSHTNWRSTVEVEVTLRLIVCLGIEYPCGTCDQILFPQSESLCGWQSVSISWCRAHFVDVWPGIASFSSVWVWNVLCCLCGAPSLTRGRVCPCLLQLYHTHIYTYTLYNIYNTIQ
jgi:hypothetical protein